MFFIAGITPKTGIIDKTPLICPACGLAQVRLQRVDHWFSLFFIPVFRVKKGTPFLFCSRCELPVGEGTQTAAGKPEPGQRPERHVVLVNPEVHWNTGNIGRTCLGAGARLHLIRPLGFSLDSRQVKRAGLDYWPRVNLSVWDDLDTLEDTLKIRPEEVVLLTKTGTAPFWSMPSPQRLFLVFGSETKGLPASILARYPDATYHIPITKEIRSLNLSTAAAIVLYESLRTNPSPHEW